MNVRGYKIGGLYKIERLEGVLATDAIPNHFSFTIIPNNAIIMVLEHLDNGNAMVLYEDKKFEIGIGTLEITRLLLDPRDI
jgi:hypothetical protein